MTGTPGNGQVALAWTAPANTGGSAITGYQVQVAQTAGGPYSDAAGCPTSSTTPSCTATGLTNGTLYFFKVAAKSAVGQGVYSTASRGVVLFTDDPLVPGVTPIRAVHVRELRTLINVVRAQRGLPPYPWGVDDPLVPDVTTIRALHIADLRTALSEAYATSPPVTPPHPIYTDPVLIPGVTLLMKGLHITEIRDNLRALE